MFRRRFSRALPLLLFCVALACCFLPADQAAAQAGRVDPAFNPNFGALGGTVDAIGIQSDGRLIVGGAFQQRLARINTDGTPDPAFVNARIGNYVAAIAILPNNQILAAGPFVDVAGELHRGIARFNADGSLDESFRASVNGSVYALALQPDGKIIVGGDFTSADAVGGTGIARLNADGSVDTSFNTGFGVYNTDGSAAQVKAIALLPDGRVFIGGHFTTVDLHASHSLALLTAGGSYDPGFNPGAGANDDVLALAVQTDGRLLVGGSFTTYAGANLPHIARLQTSGSTDTTFQPGAGTNNNVTALALRPSGQIVVAGGFSILGNAPRNDIGQLNANGSVDAAAFSPPPLSGLGFLAAVALDSSGRAVVGGTGVTLAGTIGARGLARLNADGGADPSFGSLSGPLPGLDAAVYAAVAQPDGSAFIGGAFTAVSGTPRGGIAKLNADGSLNTGFNPGVGADNEISAVAVQPDGKVLIGGTFGNVNGVTRVGVARLNADGSVDTAFGTTVGARSGSFIGTVTTILLQADGRIFIGGQFTSYNGVARNRFARLNTDGSLDMSFNPSGGANDTVSAAALQEDGRLLVGGQFTSCNGYARAHIARLNADGSLDTGFNPGAGFSDTVAALALQADGRILVGGYFLSYNGAPCSRVARLNADGSLDGGFNAGAIGLDAAATLGGVFQLAPQADGSIVIGGEFNFVGGQPQANLARLTPAGVLDPAFHANASTDGAVFALATRPDGSALAGGFFATVDGESHNFLTVLAADGTVGLAFNIGALTNGMINTLATQADGSVVVGGDFTLIDAVPRNRVARLRTDGGVDPAFDPGAGADGPVYAAVLQADGKVLIGGDFSSVNGVPCGHLARLNPDGGVDTSFLPTGVDGAVYALALQSDNDILVGGDFAAAGGKARHNLARLKPSGKVDNKFNPDAIGATGEGAARGGPRLAGLQNFGVDGIVRALAAALDGGILAGGEFTRVGDASRAGIARFKASGARDDNFQPGGGANGAVRSLLAMSDGSVVLGGDFTSVNGSPHNRVAKLRGDGSVDEGFDPDIGGLKAASGAAPPPASRRIALARVGPRALDISAETVSSLFLQNGQIVLGGAFTRLAETLRNLVARVDATTGQVDPAFDPGAGPNAAVAALQVQPDGKTLVGGGFTSVDGAPRDSIGRLLGDGGAVAATMVTISATTPDTGVGGDPGVLLVSRSGPVTTPLVVAYVVKGTALAGVNYKPLSGLVTIPAGSAGGPILIKALDDGQRGGEYKLKIVLKPGDGYTVGLAKKAVVSVEEAP